MYKTKTKRRAPVAANARHDVRVQSDFEHYTLVGGALLGAFFGLLFGFGW